MPERDLSEEPVDNGRVALVIGNGAYASAVLTNPVNDARAIADTLGRLGFEVIEGHDLDADAMDRKLAEFAARIEEADTALFFYAGHGLQIDGENYLVPVDAELSHVGQLNRETIRLQDQLTMMSERARVSILLLDCCRDNPFVRSLRRARPGQTRSLATQAGLAEMGAEGALIAFATAPGQVAADGGDDNADGNSPFTAALLKHLPEEGISLADVMTEVTNSVMLATGDAQAPWVHYSLRRRLVLRPRVSPAPLPNQGGFGLLSYGVDQGERGKVWQGPTLDPPMAAPAPASVVGPGPGSLGKRLILMLGALPLAALLYFAASSLLTGKDPDPRPDIEANAPGVSASDLLRRLGDINAGDRSIRRTTTAQIEAALTGTDRLSDRDRLALATALVRMASDVSRRGLSDQGRINLFYLLGRLDPTDWSNPDWVMVRAEARRALLDLNAAAASGQNAIGDQTRRVLDKLQPNIVLAREPRPLVINFSNQQFGGGITRDQAAAAQQALTALGWEVRGPDGSEATSRAATGRNEVRYDSGGDRDDAQKAALDLVAAGYPVMRGPVSVSAIGSGPIEVWLSSAPPVDRWKASPPKSAWCFQRQGPLTENGSYSVRCHKDAATCTRVRGDSPGERSSPCVFMPFLDTTTVSLQGGGTADSYFRYSREPFAAPFPALP